jgi:two-component system, OmpR family, manganese sensing sensor histidine kinase
VIAVGLSALGSLWLNRQSMRPIEESFARLKQFTADASHELRGPLMVMMSNVEFCLKYPQGMRSDDREAMTVVLSAAEQMTQLTEDLLLLARAERVSMVEWQSVDLSTMLQQLLQLYRLEAQAKGIQLTTEVAFPLRVVGDATKLERAFRNLLHNAIHYTLKGGSVNLQAMQSDQQILVTVEDTGIGIAPEHLDHIFERFWRADQARSYDGGGSGLGLAIAQTLIQLHGGAILVSSELGVGSCFVVQLPTQPSPRHVQPSRSRIPDPGQGHLNRHRPGKPTIGNLSHTNHEN